MVKITKVVFVFLWTLSPVISRNLEGDQSDVEYEQPLHTILQSSSEAAEKSGMVEEKPCIDIHPTAKEIIRRVYAVLPYFDKDKTNTKFLAQFRSTLNAMALGQDPLDREAAFYVAIITPGLFLQYHQDMWCFVEKYYKALLTYKKLDQIEKRYALKTLQNLKNVALNVFIDELPGTAQANESSTLKNYEDDLIKETDVIYLKELIKNLG